MQHISSIVKHALFFGKKEKQRSPRAQRAREQSLAYGEHVWVRHNWTEVSMEAPQ